MKLWPTRQQAKRENDPVVDLDAIVAEPVHFRLRGKIHTLKPLALDEFLKFTNAQNALMESLKDDQKLDAKTLAERYLGVISSVCDTITIDDLMGMEQVQVAALYQLVIDMVTGQTDFDGSGKKKRLKIPIYEYAQASLSPSAPGNSGGH